MKRFIVVGLGNFGITAAETLCERGHDVIVIDRDGTLIDRIAPHVTKAALGDGTDIDTLERIGAASADAGIISTGDDITSSILATMALQDLGVEHVYCKVISRDHARVMDRLNVTESIFPERDSAISLATRLLEDSLLQYVQLGDDFGIQEMAVPDAWDGKSIRELGLRQEFGITIVAMHHVLTGRMQPNPDPDYRLKASDAILVAGSNETLSRVAKAK
ncbi:potassium channel family protein [Calycomorphotria hydatis]|uniref:Trk system potassium uptake protein TrkA n=1 Tax=Calycomorphotria hydatis TaxID=2528027 RepID=A0A517T7I9_9PLAN|nr:TrkA family potassium uptake protein [Calycomorphotria hydatis]QDT64344.1 Ktr system potassium uptake protein A [Calycomorphotria hydatis]